MFAEVLGCVRPKSVVASYFDVPVERARGWIRKSRLPSRYWKQFAQFGQRYGFNYDYDEIVELAKVAGLKPRSFRARLVEDQDFSELRIKLMKSCRKLARNTEELEDAVQAGLITYMELGGDTFSFAYKCVWNEIRRARWRRDKEADASEDEWQSLEAVVETAFLEASPSVRSQESLSAGRDEFLLALANISLIPPRPRLMLLMYALGYSYKEIAIQLGVKMGTVSSRINEARGLLNKTSTAGLAVIHRQLRESNMDAAGLLDLVQIEAAA